MQAYWEHYKVLVNFSENFWKDYLIIFNFKTQ